MAVTYSEADLNAIMNDSGRVAGSYASNPYGYATTTTTGTGTLESQMMADLMDRYFNNGSGIGTRSKKEKYKKHKIERLILMEE